MGRETLGPILFLLQSHDVEVQRASSAALGNLAVNGEVHFCSRMLVGHIIINKCFLFLIAENKLMIVQLGGLNHLIRQMSSPNVEVQCNAVGCITNLATHGNMQYA